MVQRYQRFLTLFWVALGIFVSVYSYRLGIGKLLEPGPGLMPLILGVAISLLALFKLVKTLSRAGGDEKTAAPSEAETSGRPILGMLFTVVASLLAYALLLEPLGYLITTFLVMAFLLRAAGYKRWRRIMPYAAVIAVVSYFGFTYLGTRFPGGILTFAGLG